MERQLKELQEKFESAGRKREKFEVDER